MRAPSARMARSPTPGGHGVSIWVAAFTSLASPALRVMRSVRWAYRSNSSSPQIPLHPPATSAARIDARVRRRMSVLLVARADHDAGGGSVGGNDVGIGALQVPAHTDVINVALAHLGLAVEEEVEVVARGSR